MLSVGCGFEYAYLWSRIQDYPVAFAIEMIVLPQKEKRTLGEQARLDLIKDSMSHLFMESFFSMLRVENTSKSKQKKSNPISEFLITLLYKDEELLSKPLEKS